MSRRRRARRRSTTSTASRRRCSTCAIPRPGNRRSPRASPSLVASERVGLDPDRGLDHGAWSVLIAMYPAADVPVVQLSMDTRLPGAHHYALARQLAPLRDEGVLVLGSGNFVHNLRLFDFRDPAPLDWALAADAEIRGHIAAGRHDELAGYPVAPRSAPAGADARALPAPAVRDCTATTGRNSRIFQCHRCPARSR